MADERDGLPPADFLSDLPVTGESELAFEFDGLADTLTRLARNPGNRTPFTVVVRGGWGRGKTTLLRQIQHRLEEERQDGERRISTIWFNAWKYPREDTILAGLLGALIDRLRRGTTFDRIKALLDSQGGLARIVLRRAAPAVFGELGQTVTETMEGAGRYSVVDEKRAFHDTFRDLFAQVSHLDIHAGASIKDLDGRSAEELWTQEDQEKHALAVFLDDLDRCPDERVLEVLEAINLFLDLPGTCFYLGLDWDRLRSVLEKKMGDRAEEFLEKIVQVSFELPDVNVGGAREYIHGLVRGMSLAEHFDDEGVALTIAEALESRHPRHVKRFLNDLAMGLAVVRQAGRLGDDEEQVPDAAVLAWHLLHEVLPSEEWSEIRADSANLDVFLRRWAETRDKEELGEDEATAGLRRVHGSSGLTELVGALSGLTVVQRDHLTHFGSPPREEQRRRVRGRPGAGGIEWVDLKGGTFRMGSDAGGQDERPVHDVELSPFRISRYPVTNAQYAEFVAATSHRQPSHWKEGVVPPGRGRHPVVGVSWKDAEAYCNWLGRMSEVGAVQLPTEAQWEYSARGTGGREYPWGDDEPTPERANFAGSVGSTTPVDAYPGGATPEGVHDLAGNVWEWCRDWHAPYSNTAIPDPSGPSSGSSRVLRGCSWADVPRNLRSAHRDFYRPDARDDLIGFRVAWSPA